MTKKPQITFLKSCFKADVRLLNKLGSIFSKQRKIPTILSVLIFYDTETFFFLNIDSNKISTNCPAYVEVSIN